VRVAQLLTAVLDALDRDINDPGTSNGDVLRGIAMALAIRAAMIEAPKEQTDAPVRDLVAVALAAMDDSERRYAQVGHA
jgi:hypothetical protein